MVRVGSGTPRRAVLAGASPRLKPLVVAIGLALGAGAGTPTMAATFPVTNLFDSGGGSLRDAVTQANSTAGADVINIGVTGTIPLATTIAVTDQLTINGPGASLLTITPPAGSYALTNVSQVAISGVTFAGGSGGLAAVGSAGGLGSLTLQSCVFSNNSGTIAGAVFNYFGSVFISDSTFNNNTATGTGTAAGAVLGAGGTLSITNSTFSGNQGPAGAIVSVLGTFVMTNSTISGNTGSNTAGGIYLADLAVPAEIRNSTLSGNVATSGPAGAILVANVPTASITLNLTSTIAANSTSSSSGTIDIARLGTTTINATNSLIKNAAGAINGTNTANIFGVDPLLGPLQNNGGPTWTQALLPGSPAINTGSNPLALTTDQRGAGFARTVGSATDIGAYEVQAPASAATAIPTLSEWGTVALAALLGGVTLLTGLGRRRRDG